MQEARPTSRRAPRSDGRENRAKILQAAARAFAVDGADATLNSIARDAGVGIATLFRHFPTRDDLMIAAYSESIDYLCAAADELLARMPPLDAARAWMGRYLDYMSTKAGMADTVRALLSNDVDSRVHTLDRLLAAVELLLRAGRSSGAVVPGTRADDVLAALAGIAVVAGRPAQRPQADRLADLLVRGVAASRV
ncbi:hypothetical protein AX769_17015 [Frondihabitans sp. PAMC 28766]|uniref:TetR/AcrR family transcriptional regulator n=1 Tax=Frondihabitans sp. PAMC 28766 TaxID=1795630 RepID=UPI00078D6C8F|nr:TetR/AcrR family transcriptional regulator [Frondihabitans sp. PAMC 28766]AMM21531.1 hypothetical protein AX769_17015 [Frondihabitans sp. PAMC 28766]